MKDDNKKAEGAADDNAEDKEKKTADPAPPKKEDSPAPKAEPKAKTPEPDDDDEDDGEEGEKLEDEQLIKISQARLDQIIEKRLEKQRRSLGRQHRTELDTLKAEVEGLKKERESYLGASLTAAQAEIDALPEEVKALCPIKPTDAESLAKVTDWLKGAKTLAEKLGGKTPPKKEEPAPKTPPKQDPPPAGGKTNNEPDAAKNNPLWMSF